jgi:hypothetical protein
MDWLPEAYQASGLVQLVVMTVVGLGALALVLLGIYVAAIRRAMREAQDKITKMETARRQNEARLDGLTTAVERLARHHHIGATMGQGPVVGDDQPVIVEQTVDGSIPWVNPVHAIHDHPEIVRDTDLPLERFADPAPITDPNLRAVPTGDGRALPPVPPDPRRLRQYVTPARNITSEPITAVDAPVIVPVDPGRARHAAPDGGRHAAQES